MYCAARRYWKPLDVDMKLHVRGGEARDVPEEEIGAYITQVLERWAEVHDLLEVDWVGARLFEVHDCDLAYLDCWVVQLRDKEGKRPVRELRRVVKQSTKMVGGEQARVLLLLAHRQPMIRTK